MPSRPFVPADGLPHDGVGGLRRYDLAHLRHCVGAGEPLNPEVIEAWKAGTGLTIS